MVRPRVLRRTGPRLWLPQKWATSVQIRPPDVVLNAECGGRFLFEERMPSPKGTGTPPHSGHLFTPDRNRRGISKTDGAEYAMVRGGTRRYPTRISPLGNLHPKFGFSPLYFVVRDGTRASAWQALVRFADTECFTNRNRIAFPHALLTHPLLSSSIHSDFPIFYLRSPSVHPALLFPIPICKNSFETFNVDRRSGSIVSQSALL